MISTRCPFCRCPLKQDRVVSCPQCHTPQHLGCWQENSNSCSVYKCSGQIEITAHRRIDLLAFHLAFNVASHFFINQFAPLVFTFHLQDAIFVTGLELAVIISGLLMWQRIHFRTDSALGFLQLVVLSANSIFLSVLICYGLLHGIQALFGLIRV
jgi:Prokaryotic RING finger family 1